MQSACRLFESLWGGTDESGRVVFGELSSGNYQVRQGEWLYEERTEIEVTCTGRQPLRVTVEVKSGDTRVEVGAP